MNNPVPTVAPSAVLVLNGNNNIDANCPNYFFSIKNSSNDVIYTNIAGVVCSPSPCVTWIVVDTTSPYTNKLTVT